MSLIVVEGLDGAGKSTQIEMLRKYFENNGFGSNFLHFPRMEEPFFGELISKFLRGEFGKLKDVNPYLVAMIYAGDRKDASEIISKWLNNGQYVLLDRYVYSNIAYQCAKLPDITERNKLKEWILKLEFEHFNIPRPSLNIFLDVPFSFTEEKLDGKRTGTDRDYLNGNSDIHEASLQFQKMVRQVYIDYSRSDPALEILNCSDLEGNILPPQNIFENILRMLQQKQLLK
jgi:dTMP kinase